MTPTESAAHATLQGLAIQLQELDYSNPTAWSAAICIADEIAHVANRAMQPERKTRTGSVTRAEIDSLNPLMRIAS